MKPIADPRLRRIPSAELPGDVRSVLGQSKAWIDQHFMRPEPPLPAPNGEPLVLRWALNIRGLCAALRLVLAGYGEARDAAAPEMSLLRWPPAVA